MSFLIRDVVPFPSGSNATDVLINALHYNRTTLDFFNYTLYSNGTLSNVSQCFLVFGQYKPLLLDNGTYVNGTSCFSPINHIRTRGALGIVFGALFAITIVFTLTNLRKHGRTFLPRRGAQRRWNKVERRWQWYWMVVLAVCGIISSFTAVDVDRYYLPAFPLILQSLFYYLMLPTVLACVWEATRNWSSLQTKLLTITTTNDFPPSQPQHMRMTLPLLFHLTIFLTFFLTIPRSWSPIQQQRSQSQTNQIAIPAATDARFKAGCFVALSSWLLICYTVLYSLKHHHYLLLLDRHHHHDPLLVNHHPSPLPIPHTTTRLPPTKILLLLLTTLSQIVYTLISTFLFTISPLNLTVNPAWLYALGYTPSLLTLLILNIYGAYLEDNADVVLLKTRAMPESSSRIVPGPDAGVRGAVNNGSRTAERILLPTTSAAAYADYEGERRDGKGSGNHRYQRDDDRYDYEMTPRAAAMIGSMRKDGGRGDGAVVRDGDGSTGQVDDEESHQSQFRQPTTTTTQRQQQHQQRQRQQVVRSMLDV